MHILIIHPPPSLSRKYSIQKRETGYSKPIHYYCPASVYFKFSRAITAVLPGVDSLAIKLLLQ